MAAGRGLEAEIIDVRTILTALFLVCLGTVPVLAEGEPAAGEAAYARACARCHASVARLMRDVEGETEEQTAAWLDTFLAGHRAPDAEMRADLIAFLLAE